jgi:hypothetical protein
MMAVTPLCLIRRRSSGCQECCEATLTDDQIPAKSDLVNWAENLTGVKTTLPMSFGGMAWIRKVIDR